MNDGPGHWHWASHGRAEALDGVVSGMGVDVGYVDSCITCSGCLAQHHLGEHVDLARSVEHTFRQVFVLWLTVERWWFRELRQQTARLQVSLIGNSGRV